MTIIWTARRPKVGGTYIVGWYKNARLYRTFQPGTKYGNRTFKGKQMGFIAVAERKDCKLLPPDKRLLKIPRGLNGMGQRNVWYADKSPRFVKTVRNFIQNGSLPKSNRKTAGRGYPIQIDPLKRQLVETNAVRQIIKYYKTEGYNVRSVEKDNLGWDLYATYNDIELKLEVKGLSGSAIIAELTPNEYEQLKKHKDSYRLCIVAKALTAKPDVRIFSYSTDLKEWLDDDGNILDVSPIISARVSI